MRTTLAGFVVVIVSLTAVLLGAQSEPPAVNPLAGNADAIQSGMGLFRSRCADCHGMDARGVRGPDLTQVWASGRSDGGLFRTLRRGVPGTEMPSVGPRTPDDEIWKILAYLKTIAAPTASDVEVGNAQNGERVFRAQCAGCHRVDGTGGRLGPDLSRIGVARARGAIVRRVRGATEDFLEGYQPVIITLRQGEREICITSFSGNTVTVNLDHGKIILTPVVTGDGHVIVEGKDFVWSQDKVIGRPAVTLDAKMLGVSL